MWDFSKFLELTIDRPTKDVWPYLFRPKNDVWSKTAYTTVAGKPGKVGEIYEMAYPLENQGGLLSFEAITVELEKHIVLKIAYKKDEKSARQLSGYDFFTLKEESGRTTVFFQQATELPVDPGTDFSHLAEKHNMFLDDIFQDLKKAVEGIPLGNAKNPWRS
jgi:hypothetical protein